MQLREHLDKLSWTALDKILFIVYGVVTLVQIRALLPEEYALAVQLITLQTWIFIISDGSALQAMIQFGVKESERGKVNVISLVMHGCISLGFALLIATFSQPLAIAFGEPRFYDVALTLPLFCLLTIPRAFTLKLMQRELHMRDIFLTNLAWFGTMTALTMWMLWRGTLQSFDDMVVISLAGISVSSAVGVALSRSMLVFNREGVITVKKILRFGLPQALMMSMNNVIRQLDLFFIQLFFNNTAATGVYSSAKMLFRLFETATDAGMTLMYPTAVRLLAQGRRDHIIVVFSKAISFLLIPTIVAVLVLLFGGTEIIVGIMGNKYLDAASQFNTMLAGALFLPFFVLQSVDLALHKVAKLLGIVTISVTLGIATIAVAGVNNALYLSPLGVVVYSFSMAVLLLLSVRSDLHFPLADIFRAVPDTISYVKSLRGKKTHSDA